MRGRLATQVLTRVQEPGRLWFLLRNRIEQYLTGRAIDQFEAEQFGAFAQGLELASAIEV
jgi:hypothetical protein